MRRRHLSLTARIFLGLLIRRVLRLDEIVIVPRDSHDPFLASSIGDVAVERRRSHRETIVAIGRLTPADAGEGLRSLQILVTDVSLHGCDFKCAVSPSDGAYYQIDLHVGPLSLTSRMRVIRVQPRSDGTFEAGAEFI